MQFFPFNSFLFCLSISSFNVHIFINFLFILDIDSSLSFMTIENIEIK